jgi:hypothetical protein
MPLQAAQITWTLQNVTFSDGGTATGSFVVDTSQPVSSSSVVSYNITAFLGNSADFPTFTYENGVASSFNPTVSGGGARVQFNTNVRNPDFGNRVRTLLFSFSESVLTAQGTVSVLTGFNSVECWNCFPLRTVTGGTVVPTFDAAVPEPGTWAMLAAGLAGLTLLRRRA